MIEWREQRGRGRAIEVLHGEERGKEESRMAEYIVYLTSLVSLACSGALLVRVLPCTAAKSRAERVRVVSLQIRLGRAKARAREIQCTRARRAVTTDVQDYSAWCNEE